MASKPTIQGRNQKDTVAGAYLVTKNARLIIQQADIAHIKEIPNLPTHQAAAKVQANKWEKDIWPQIMKTTTDIIDFANTYQATYDQLKKLVPKLQAGDKTAKNEFIHALEVVLISNLKAKSKTAKTIAASIKQFHDKFQPLYNQFQTDFTQANKKLTQDNQAILTKQAELASWKAKAESYFYAAMGSLATFPAIILAYSYLLIAATGGLVIGSILLIATEAVVVTTITTTTILYAQAEHHVNDLINQINTLKTEVAQLTLIEHQITGLQKHTLKVVTASAQVADGWVVLEQDLNKTIAHLKTISPQEIAKIVPQLDAANIEWGTVLKQAEALQPKGGKLVEKKYSSFKDMQSAINKQAGI